MGMSEYKAPNKVNLNFKIESSLIARMEKRIDNMRYRSKGHFAEIAILDLLEKLEENDNYKTRWVTPAKKKMKKKKVPTKAKIYAKKK